MFLDREQELAFLNSLLKQPRSAAQMVLLYGRRRVGKTVLARTWAERSGHPIFYWAAERETAPLQRRKLFAKILGVPMSQAPAFESWTDLWTAFAAQVGDRPHILILDEVPQAAEADPAFLSALQHAWDQNFKNSSLYLLLSGSHVHTMETLLAHGSPLFGRFTGQWHLQPLPFSAVRHFLPRWPADQRVAVYAILGGVPAYLERLRADLSLTENLREVVLSSGSIFVAEPDLLLFDEVREPRVYRTILQAIGGGAQTLDEVANAALIGKSHLSAYLTRLQELRLVERRLPATVPPGKQQRSRVGRYHLADPFLRFFFRFIAPRQDEIGYQPERVLSDIQDRLRAFVATAFEVLCREWVSRASRAGRLPFEVEFTGAHWSRGVQVDVVGINWRKKAILLGECKWRPEAVARDVVAELVEDKTPRVLRVLPEEGRGWAVYYALFAKRGFTPAARSLAQTHRAALVDLKQLDRELE